MSLHNAIWEDWVKLHRLGREVLKLEAEVTSRVDDNGNGFNGNLVNEPRISLKHN